jgi:hypothetical protein
MNLKSLFYGFDEDPYYENFLSKLPYANSNIIVPIITILYLLSIFSLMKVMKHYKPFKIMNIIQLYNLFQIFANVAILFIGLMDFEFINSLIINLTGENIKIYRLKTKLITLSYFWCLIKISDFLDTIFFILRKKFSHVTFLHVYHHSTTMLLSYIVFRYNHIEQTAVAAVINCMVHVAMYLYYFLSSIGYRPKWKRAVTIFQIVQFFIIAVGNLTLIFIQSDPRYFYMSIYLVAQCLMYIFLFTRFYYKTYKNSQKKLE